MIFDIFHLSDESAYELKDDEFEAKFRFSLKKTLLVDGKDKLFAVRSFVPDLSFLFYLSLT